MKSSWHRAQLIIKPEDVKVSASVLLFTTLMSSFLFGFLPAASALHFVNLHFFLFSDHSSGQGIT